MRGELPPEDEVLLARVPEWLRARNGVPEEGEGATRDRAAEIARAALSDLLLPGGLRTSILGPAWSRDLDLHVATLPDPARLEALGWVGLDSLLNRLGYGGEGRWAVIEDGAVLALADFHLDPPPDPSRSVLARSRRNGEVRAREVLELRAILRSGGKLPPGDPVVAVAAGVESGLGGNLLTAWRQGPALPAPAPLSASPGSRLSRRLRRAGSRLRPRRRFVVAASGLDGAGKSTLVKSLARDLRQVGLPVTLVWTRPGMRLRWLASVGRVAKRVLRQDASPGVARIGGGERPHALASRRGVLGWTWALLVVLMFVREVRKEHRRGRGIVLCDRHVLDALVTLDIVYEGVPLRLQRTLVRRLLPPADVSLLLTVPSITALSRKPGDMFDQAVLGRQADRYAALRSEATHLHELDGTRPPEEVAAEAFRIVAGMRPGR